MRTGTEYALLKYSTLLQITTPTRRTLIFIFVLLLAGSAISLVFPLIAGKLAQMLLYDSDAPGFSIQWILWGWLTLMVIKTVLSASSNTLISSTSALMGAQLRSRVYEHMQILPLSWYQERKQGSILSLLSNDAEIVSQFVTSTMVRLIPQALTLVAAIAVMTWIDPTITALAALLLPAYFIIAKIMGRKIRPLSTAWTQSRANLVALVNENLSLIPAIKAFVREPLESKRFEQHNRDLLEISRRELRLSSVLGPIINLLAGAGSLLLLWVAIGHLESGQLTPAEMVSLLFYTLLLTGPLSALANVYGQMMHTRGAAERLLEFFGQQPEPANETGKPLQAVKGQIEFRNVSFTYPGREPVLQHFNLQIQSGETIALTGPNGAGKSTLVHLLMRFIEASDGSILIDGQDISQVELASLRSQIGLVAQNTLLLNGSVAQNICYGLQDAPEEDIKKAAKAARADEFIEALPYGYDTIIGDQGVKLSGGQRQRLSLARTLLKDPPILILDEATAMFDPEGEASFITQSAELLAQRTVILITHRPASLALADRIMNMNLGQAGRTEAPA
jgi:ATP-binding cassette subfamily B protein